MRTLATKQVEIDRYHCLLMAGWKNALAITHGALAKATLHEAKVVLAGVATHLYFGTGKEDQPVDEGN